MNKLVLLLIALVAITQIAAQQQLDEPRLQGKMLDSIKAIFKTWLQQHGKSYSLTEEIKKFATFSANFLKINAFKSTKQSFEVEINEFSDLSPEEFRVQYVIGLDSDKINNNDNNDNTPNKGSTPVDLFDPDAIEPMTQLAASVDWRAKGAVTKPKNQGGCGSCWAFATAGALEGLNQIKTGRLLSFAEQQMVDCDKSNGACHGGWPEKAMQYVAKQGINLDNDYPYVGKEGQPCRFNQGKAVRVNKGASGVGKGQMELKKALMAQPVSVCIDAGGNFQHYKRGVISTDCSPNINHAVLAVGYKIVDGKEAFIVKNSWGTGWGESGYFHVSTDPRANNGQGVCGILQYGAIPTA